MRLALAQINSVVGDIDGNAARIVDWLQKARDANADLVLFPELVVTGYPPEDLLLRPGFVRAARRAVDEIAKATHGVTVLVGAPYLDADLYNACFVLEHGEVRCIYRKRYLPNYGVFDEDRYFAPGDDLFLLRFGDVRIGPTICEDIWQPGPPATDLALAGAQLIANISASPFHVGKDREREEMLRVRALDNSCFVALCNAVGGQDELIFDGHSVVLDDEGQVLARAAGFVEELLVADVDPARGSRPQAARCAAACPSGARAGHGRADRVRLRAAARPARCEAGADRPSARRPRADASRTRAGAPRLRAEERLRGRRARSLGGHRLGPDGGAVRRGAGRRTRPWCLDAVALFVGRHARRCARLAESLGIDFREIAIEPMVEAYTGALHEHFVGRESDLTEENLQARIRGTLLMALSNKFGWLVIATGNKSELSVGYSTLYGDLAGGFALIKDVYKTDVFRLSRWLNERAGRELIRRRSSSGRRAPSPRRPARQDSLPPYPELDQVLEAYVELDRSREELSQDGFDADVVDRAARHDRPRRVQAPPGAAGRQLVESLRPRPPHADHQPAGEARTTTRRASTTPRIGSAIVSE